MLECVQYVRQTLQLACSFVNLCNNPVPAQPARQPAYKPASSCKRSCTAAECCDSHQYTRWSALSTSDMLCSVVLVAVLACVGVPQQPCACTTGAATAEHLQKAAKRRGSTANHVSNRLYTCGNMSGRSGMSCSVYLQLH